MKNRNHLLLSAAAALMSALLLTGCGGSAEALAMDAAKDSGGGAAAVETAAVVETAAAAETAAAESASGYFTKRDLAQTADLSGAEKLTVSDGRTVTITKAGIYVLSGSAKEACVLVEAGDDDKVQLVLDGVSIVNSASPCILVENADKVFLTSAEGSENSLSVTGSFTGDDDAVVFSRDDLVLNGLGTVTVSSTEDGVRSNDELKLTGGEWIVNASGTAVKAHEGIYACGGTYQLTAGSDGLHAEDNNDDSVGCVVIEGGVFAIKAGDDGIHGTTLVTISDGTVAVSAAEGIEATQITLSGGSVSVEATDDGVNASRKSTALSVKVEITGGELTIVMGAGDTDAIDSNGELIISGGEINITAQSPFDYDGNCSYTGGKIIVNGVETNSVSNQFMGGGQMGGQMGGRPGGQMGGGQAGGGQMGGFAPGRRG